MFLFLCFFFFFFFSSRRRHTRWNCDWSSDVCSSDLVGLAFAQSIGYVFLFRSFNTSAGTDIVKNFGFGSVFTIVVRSEEHTSELQSQFHLVCRLLLEKKKKKKRILTSIDWISPNTCF